MTPGLIPSTAACLSCFLGVSPTENSRLAGRSTRHRPSCPSAPTCHPLRYTTHTPTQPTSGEGRCHSGKRTRDFRDGKVVHRKGMHPHITKVKSADKGVLLT